MEIRYYRDPETGLPHIYEHGVKEAEAEWILAHPGEDEALVIQSQVADLLHPFLEFFHIENALGLDELGARTDDNGEN